jgi:hypothetical protein
MIKLGNNMNFKKQECGKILDILVIIQDELQNYMHSKLNINKEIINNSSFIEINGKRYENETYAVSCMDIKQLEWAGKRMIDELNQEAGNRLVSIRMYPEIECVDNKFSIMFRATLLGE